MNEFLLAVVGLLAMFIVGVICYGVIFKASVGDNAVKLTPTRFVIAAIGMYVIAFAFIRLFGMVTMDASGVMKGLQLGLMVGIPFFMIPLFADAPYFKGKAGVEWAVIINWVFSFAVLGMVVGGIGVTM